MRIMRLLILLFLFCAPARAADDTVPQPYIKVRYPTFANGRLKTMLEADQATAYDLSEGTPQVELKNVRITMYDDSAESLEATPPDQPLPVRMVITSDEGSFARKPHEAGANPEEIADLRTNVVVRQMRLKPQPPNRRPSPSPHKLEPGVEMRLNCDHAQWNNSLRKLNGDGPVEMIQEDSRITGIGFLYLADDEAMRSPGGASNIREWGGIIFVEHDARMEIYRDSVSSNRVTVITCRDTASYKLREKEIQFERTVKVTRPDLTIESDILKVFLRTDDDAPAPVSRCGGSQGQVKNIVATIGNRPGSVIITGYDPLRGGAVVFTAAGGRADFDYDNNRINLTDSRLERVPRVTFGRDEISDRNLGFIFTSDDCTPGTANQSAVLETLTADGGQGQVYLAPRQTAETADAPCDISYKGDMTYSRTEGRIRFSGSVFLKRADLRLKSEFLDVRLARSPGSEQPDQFQRMIAETDVSIITDTHEARAQRAEYDLVTSDMEGLQDQALDVLRLFGMAADRPPHPWVRDNGGNQITAPYIVLQRLKVGAALPRHYVQGSGGVATCDFFTRRSGSENEGRIISIKCENGMEYNEVRGLAWFQGQVMATSDAAEDNYVMTCDRLDIYLVEETQAGADTPFKRLRRIDASGNARMMQDARVCTAHQIIRDFPSTDADEGDIYLEGLPAAGGRAARPATYQEQLGGMVGAMFVAPRIKSSPNGDKILANGPGQLSMPDEDMPGQRSEIHFDGGAQYEALPGGVVSEAKFRRNVVLRQPSRRLVITGEEMDSRFVKDQGLAPLPAAAQAGTGTVSIERMGRLRRAEARRDVRIDQTDTLKRRQAAGDTCVVEFTDTGNVITLSSDRTRDPNRFAIVRDSTGMAVRAPQVEVRELQGITRASGPGELQLPGNGQAEGDGFAKLPTRVLYGERGVMIYNEVAMNIRASDNVRIIQPGPGNNWRFPSLDGRCDQMEIVLIEPPSERMTGEETLHRVLRMDALGGVLLRVYADPPPDNPNIDWLSRPGTTFFARGDQAVYDVPEGRIVMSSLPGRQPQLLLNMVDPGSPPRRQRMKADRFILNTNTVPRRWYFEGKMDSSTLRDGEAFEFVE